MFQTTLKNTKQAKQLAERDKEREKSKLREVEREKERERERMQLLKLAGRAKTTSIAVLDKAKSGSSLTNIPTGKGRIATFGEKFGFMPEEKIPAPLSTGTVSTTLGPAKLTRGLNQLFSSVFQDLYATLSYKVNRMLLSHR